jgi:hypothetical protein
MGMDIVLDGNPGCQPTFIRAIGAIRGLISKVQFSSDDLLHHASVYVGQAFVTSLMKVGE